MADAIEFIQLEPGEDATSVRDRLSFYRGQRVLLIWPEEGTALTRKLDLVLVQREAMRRAIRLALVTHDESIIEHAKELNVSTFETIGASQRGRWKRGRGKIFTSRIQKPEDEPEPEELMPVASRVRVTSKVSLSGAARGLIILTLAGVFIALIVLVIPGATVTIDLAEDDIRVNTEILASPLITTLDVENGIIPARLRKIEITESWERPSTGIEALPPVPANGIVTFINQSENSIAIPAGTIVSTSSGAPIRFQTMEAITLPAGAEQRADSTIRALPEYAGYIGNVDAGVINTVDSEWQASVIVLNQSPTSGGEDRTLPVVTETDRERLLAAVRQQIQTRALEEFQAQLGENEIMIPETLSLAPESNRADWQTFSAEVGAYEPTLRLTLRAIVQVVIIDEQLAHQVVFARMGQQLPRGRSILLETLEYTSEPVKNVDEQGQVTFSMTGSGKVAGQVNTIAVQERLAGLTTNEALTYLTSAVDLESETPPQIVITPNLLNRLPLLPVRINVQIID
jgi:hypothetical protein